MIKIEKNTGYFKGIDGHSIYYESRGQGDTLVFVYGLACVTNHWHYQIEYFSQFYRTVVFDLRGHHRTHKPENDDHLSLDYLAHDIHSLLKHLNIKKAHFAGHSFGVPILLKAYDLYPEIFSSMTLINGFARSPIQDMFGLGIVEKIYRLLKEGYEKNPTLWTNIWRLGIDSPLSIPLTSLVGGFNIKLTHLKDIEIYTKGVANMDLSVFLKLFDELMKFNGKEILPRVTCPTLIIAGEKDGVTPASFQLELEETIPESELMNVPYGSHCTQLDFPEYVNLRLEKFLKAHRESPNKLKRSSKKEG